MIAVHFPALIVVTPLILAFIVFAAGSFARRLCFPLVLVALASSLISAAGILAAVLAKGSAIHYRFGSWAPPWGIEYVVDHLNALMLISIAIVALLAAIYARSSIDRDIPHDKVPAFYALFLLQVTGLLGMTITGDAFNLYVLLEIASFSAYAIIAMGERAAPFAAFRYMIFGTIGACAYLLGVGYLYIITGSLNMADLRQLLPPLYHSRVLLAGFCFLLVGIGIKMALFPVHTWLPDSYSLAPSSVSVLLAPLFTKVGGYVLIRVLFTVFDPAFSTTLFPIMVILGWLAAAGILFASILALAQSDLKRMLCYLIVVEMGYVLAGVSASNRAGLTGAIFHLVNNMFTMACLFAAAGTIQGRLKTLDIYRLRGLHRMFPVTSALFVLAGLSVVGIPPLCGFFSKWYLIVGVIEARQWILLAVLLVSTLLNALLFFRIFEQVYFVHSDGDGAHETGSTPSGLDPVPLGELIPMALFGLALLLIGIFSGPIIASVIRFTVPAVFT